MAEKYKFNISLSVLNHLGRNLYRNIITVLGEAISNSWDADAKNVRINIDKKNKKMIIIDDGEGMNNDDFQNKFLKIGYSKRKDGRSQSKKGRPYIGRKGIGKLALLSCADTIWVVSKKQGENTIGGGINNKSLDQAISEDISSNDYVLEQMSDDISKTIDGYEHGTAIVFDGIIPDIYNTIEYLQKAIALYFRFEIVDSNFNIYVNDRKIYGDLLGDLFSNTEFLWRINNMEDPHIEQMKNVKIIDIKSDMNIKGYISSVTKPSTLKIRGTDEKVSVDLFVNGRMRERDILKHIPSSRIVESYVYGQIYYDDLDAGDKEDYFTSSREEIVANSPIYKSFLKEIKRIFKQIIEEWDELRLKKGEDGDPDNESITKTERKAIELFSSSYSSYKGKHKGSKGIQAWESRLKEEARFNIPSYTECFISENILRKYIKVKKMELSPEAKKEAQEHQRRESESKEKVNISYAIRENESEMYYLDMNYLSNFIDKAKNGETEGLSISAKTYKPLRDAVAHTAVITDTAKKQLSVVYENIKARVSQLLDEIKKDN